jgi:hypothetical protein
MMPSETRQSQKDKFNTFTSVKYSNSKKEKKYNSGCQGLWAELDGKLLFNLYKVSVM